MDMPLNDMGNLYLLAYYGLISGIIAFIVTVILEAVIMKKFFPFSFKVRLGYSLVMNLVSVSLGFLYLKFLGTLSVPIFDGFGILGERPLIPIRTIIITLLFTVLIEFICLVILLKIFKHIQLRSPHEKKDVTLEPAKHGFWPSERKRKSLLDIIYFSIVANLASYAITFLFPVVFGIFILLIYG